MNKNRINLEGNVAVITGGAQGIGYAVAERMLQSGAQVILWDFNSEANEKAAAALSALGVVTAITADVSNWDSVTGAFEGGHGVNNAQRCPVYSCHFDGDDGAISGLFIRR